MTDHQPQWGCPYCSRVFPSKDHLKEHLELDCTSSHTPPEDASEATSTEPYSPAPDLAFPAKQPLAEAVTTEHVQQFLEILKSFGTQQEPPLPPRPTKPSNESGGPIVRASTLEFKTVNEVWDEKAYKYSIEESPKSVNKTNELDQYVFVVRARIG